MHSLLKAAAKRLFLCALRFSARAGVDGATIAEPRLA